MITPRLALSVLLLLPSLALAQQPAPGMLVQPPAGSRLPPPSPGTLAEPPPGPLEQPHPRSLEPPPEGKGPDARQDVTPPGGGAGGPERGSASPRYPSPPRT